MARREELAQELRSCLGHYVKLRLRDETLWGYVHELGEAALLLAVVCDGIGDGYELVSLRAIRAVRRAVVDEYFESLLREAGVMVPADAPRGVPLDSFRAALAWLAAREKLVSVEYEQGEADDESGFLVGRVEGVDDLRLRLRYLTTTSNWRELDVVPTRAIRRVGFGTRYLALLAGGALPWSGLAWARALSDEQRALWAPLSAMFAVIGEPVDSLRVRRLCVSYRLGEVNDYASESWGIELAVRQGQVAAVFLIGQTGELGEAFGGAFLPGIALDEPRGRYHARLGPPDVSSRHGDEQRDRYCVGPLELLFVFGEGERLRLLIIERRRPRAGARPHSCGADETEEAAAPLTLVAARPSS